ncbi:hypothetical protein M440DRAFT_1140039 [Trichoderma longibrachiatum ATCC 18648]|uniref:Uncharacterized protein n=1 Tax=Trichoderma longibrachiatum ATCC 18648 TaxID=983965 RepID=A0A2T4BQZ3_TRILO|nr:hypothetical protein M440DRAFT_1140039 [Trichoderma longibrachiatum ATCC 18648]
MGDIEILTNQSTERQTQKPPYFLPDIRSQYTTDSSGAITIPCCADSKCCERKHSLSTILTAVSQGCVCPTISEPSFVPVHPLTLCFNDSKASELSPTSVPHSCPRFQTSDTSNMPSEALNRGTTTPQIEPPSLSNLPITGCFWGRARRMERSARIRTQRVVSACT